MTREAAERLDAPPPLLLGRRGVVREREARVLLGEPQPGAASPRCGERTSTRAPRRSPRNAESASVSPMSGERRPAAGSRAAVLDAECSRIVARSWPATLSRWNAKRSTSFPSAAGTAAPRPGHRPRPARSRRSSRPRACRRPGAARGSRPRGAGCGSERPPRSAPRQLPAHSPLQRPPDRPRLTERNSITPSMISPYSCSEIAPMHGAVHRSMWKSRHGIPECRPGFSPRTAGTGTRG